ncbi:glycoside hydrolase family 3 protein [Bombardia bombarda]|uniref:beta-glucosidase n=1 Tax=Bombardia bombarda TaxID=252184 RepID=A0AA39X1L0_9PEZI|nr:glycoside hydrolase family 3 protein [Bombardia bombarda]
MAPARSLLFTAASLVAAVAAITKDVPFLPGTGAGFPSPWGSGKSPEWKEAYAKAKEFVGQLTLVEKVNLTTGTGWEADVCIGMTGSVPRLGFRGFCLEDGPLGIRYTDHNSAFPAGINVAATFSRDLMRRRGEAMGEEFHGKGIDVQLGPVAGPLGRVPQGGRNWEGFSPDPYLTGVAMAETIRGIQSRGVIACAKHYILNEQEHYRGRIDVKIDDRAMHELYLWPFADAVKADVGSVMCSYNKVMGEWACENEYTTNYLLKNELDFQGFVMSDWGAQHSTLGSALAGLDMAMPGDGGPPPYGSLWGGALTAAVLNGSVPAWRVDDMAVRIMAAYYLVHTGNYTARRPDVNFSAWTNQTAGPLHPSSNKTWALVNQRVDVQAGHAALIREIGAKSVVLLKNVNKTLPLKRPTSIAVIGEDAQDTPGGPNACPERGCIRGTLAMGYGSGTADFPYLVSPATALKLRAGAATPRRDSQTSPEAAIVFAMATAGENFITIDGNAGDRNNLTLWNGGDALIRAVASVNPNTIVVLHTVGPVVIDYAKEHPNITAILWAGLPGQESGNALVDVLYGDVNPQGRSPFTWGRDAAEYGAELLFNASDPVAPSQTFGEGVFVDYRWFEREGIAPVVAFGEGGSYTTFEYGGLKIKGYETERYQASGGVTGEAETVGKVDGGEGGWEASRAPGGFERIVPYVYPWVVGNGTAGVGNGTTGTTGMAMNGSAQPVLPAGGAPGGNPGLWEVLYTVSANIKNTGAVKGTEIPQLYLQLGGESNPFSVLRGFDEVVLEPGETKTVVFNLTRRDVSNWDTKSANWVINGEEKFVFIGSSVVNIKLHGALPALKE